MLHRCENVWFHLESVYNHATEQTDYAPVCVGSYEECERGFAARMQGGRGTGWLICWNWLHGAVCLQCFAGSDQLNSETWTHIIHENPRDGIASCLWDELVAWQHREAVVVTIPDATEDGRNPWTADNR